MNNYMLESDFKYSEIAVALEDYQFGSNVKFTIPTMFTFLNNSKPIEETKYNNKANIVNKTPVNISKYTSCNYIELYVDNNMAKGRTSGKKGDRYAVLFVGGNINNCIIIESL